MKYKQHTKFDENYNVIEHKEIDEFGEVIMFEQYDATGRRILFKDGESIWKWKPYEWKQFNSSNEIIATYQLG